MMKLYVNMPRIAVAIESAANTQIRVIVARLDNYYWCRALISCEEYDAAEPHNTLVSVVVVDSQPYISHGCVEPRRRESLKLADEPLL